MPQRWLHDCIAATGAGGPHGSGLCGSKCSLQAGLWGDGKLQLVIRRLLVCFVRPCPAGWELPKRLYQWKVVNWME